ncbi:MAG: hypothetical protein QHH18_01340 [Candidatus Bathyarchaeota archaeon]|jgi:hypothetical protein|nr:hypothetical protein [Candidatus Bathyarchaeota archaeon A05DMB-5]MDH7557236.1 hypothetical protein [Candidatus Bathyarchaeota archaeon]
MVKHLYAVWIKVDDTLPWIELKGEYPTKKAARKAVEEILNNVGVKFVKIPENKRNIKAVVTTKIA